MKALPKNILVESITKKQIFTLHLMVTIIICYLTVFGPTEGKMVIWSNIFIAFYLSSNLFILYVPNRYFIERTVFYYLIFFNSFMICLGMYLSGNASTDFYLIYFLIMGISCMSISLKYLMINTSIFVLIYGYILYQKGLLGGEMGISYSLRLPFIIIIGLFFGYIVEALIKDKKRSLEVSEEKYRSLVESINDSMYVVDADCQYLSANSNVLSEYGLTEHQIVGKKFRDFHSPEQAREFSDRIKKVIESGSTEQFEGYKENLGKWVIRKLSPIKEPNTAKIRAISVVSMDITERVEIVKELIETNKKLKETQNQLIQNEKMAVIGRLASGLAHQIRNPLEIIIMGVEYLGNTIQSKDLKHEKSIEKIKQAVNRTNQIITDFLRFSKKSELKFESVDVCLLLDETIKLIEYGINKKKVKIKKNYSEGSIKVKADRNMLQQVFMNLLNNGIDAVSEGGEIRIKVNTKTIMHEHIEDRVGYRDNDYFKIGENMTEVEIEDNGEGIPEDVLHRIFEPFYTTKESEKGTGLGLSLAHLIIDRHQGKISVQSEVNKGTKFILKLQPVSS